MSGFRPDANFVNRPEADIRIAIERFTAHNSRMERPADLTALFSPDTWRPFSMKESLSNFRAHKGQFKSMVAVRQSISTLDFYTYLKARFGKPNGMQSFMRSNDSDNLFHWDYLIKAGEINLYIVGMSRETHLMVGFELTDDEWLQLIAAIKSHFGEVGRQKSEILKTLEKWHVFSNPYVSIANLCADKHGTITDWLEEKKIADAAEESDEEYATIKASSERAARLYGDCLQLRLMTPVMAEAFINLLILALCKPDVRNDTRQYNSFIRSNIDVKIVDMFYKCEGFERRPDARDAEFTAFKAIMDHRNNRIHGNIRPEIDAFEIVYFDGTIPVYPVGGDHLAAFFEGLERQNDPQGVVADYENVHAFQAYLLSCLNDAARHLIETLADDPYPGWRKDKQRCGHLFPDYVVTSVFEGTRYDDELVASLA